MNMVLLDLYGKRKYLTRYEIDLFLKATSQSDNSISLFCEVLVSTGCRISEALALTHGSLDSQMKCVVIRSLKKRQRTIYRVVPLPEPLFNRLWIFAQEKGPSETRLWPYSRMTGYRKVTSIMASADIIGAHASPKGLRHSFGVNAIQSGVPINMVQRWLGHADIKTTAIYANALGPEERNIASLMWHNE